MGVVVPFEGSAEDREPSIDPDRQLVGQGHGAGQRGDPAARPVACRH